MQTTSETLEVNGVVLNTLAKNIESISGRLRVASLRTENITLPGRHGTLRTRSKVYDEGEIVLPMWVRGTNDDGLVAADTTSRKEFYRNVDVLTQLFRPGDGLLSVVHTLPDGSQRRIFAECTEAIDFSVSGGGYPLGKFSVALRVPGVFWEDLEEQEINLSVGHSGIISQLEGTTAPIEDSILILRGPLTSTRIESLVDDMPRSTPEWVNYASQVSAGQTLTIDCANWELLGGGGHTANYSALSHSGGSRWLTLVPGRVLTAPGIKITATNTTSQSKVTLKARRKFLVG